MRLAVDANRGWTTRDVLRVSRECTGIPFTLEQPCNTFEDHIGLRDRLQHPLFLDESADSLATILRAVGNGVCDGFGLKVTRVGGLHPMTAIREICETRSMPHTCDDAWGGDILAAACVHMGATLAPHVSEGVWIAQPYIGLHYDAENEIKVKDGYIRLPAGPGLGITPDQSLFGDSVASYS